MLSFPRREMKEKLVIIYVKIVHNLEKVLLLLGFLVNKTYNLAKSSLDMLYRRFCSQLRSHLVTSANRAVQLRLRQPL